MLAAANRTDRVNSQLAHRGAEPERRAEGFDVDTRGEEGDEEPQEEKPAHPVTQHAPQQRTSQMKFPLRSVLRPDFSSVCWTVSCSVRSFWQWIQVITSGV